MKTYNELTQTQKLKFDLEQKRNLLNSETMYNLKTIENLKDIQDFYNMGVYTVKDFTELSIIELNKLKNSTL